MDKNSINYMWITVEEDGIEKQLKKVGTNKNH